MNTKQALRLALYYRGLSAASFVVGAGIALAGLSIGLGETVAILAADFPSRVDEAMAAANLPVAFGSAVVGVLVWQVGKWAAFFRTVGRVVDGADQTTSSEHRSDGPSAAMDGKASETEAGGDASAAARQDPIVPASPSGSADESAAASDSPGSASQDSAAERFEDGAAGADRRAGGDATGDGAATDGRTGSPKPHEGEATSAGTGRDATASAASVDAESAATLADDADSVFDGDAADVPDDAVTCGDCGYPNKEGVSFCANCGAGR